MSRGRLPTMRYSMYHLGTQLDIFVGGGLGGWVSMAQVPIDCIRAAFRMWAVGWRGPRARAAHHGGDVGKIHLGELVGFLLKGLARPSRPRWPTLGRSPWRRVRCTDGPTSPRCYRSMARTCRHRPSTRRPWPVGPVHLHGFAEGPLHEGAMPVIF